MLNRENTIYSIKDNKIVENSGIKIQELPFVKKTNLRFNPSNNDYLLSCEKILDAILPTKSNTYSENKKVKVIWLGPDEWLVINEDENDLFNK